MYSKTPYVGKFALAFTRCRVRGQPQRFCYAPHSASSVDVALVAWAGIFCTRASSQLLGCRILPANSRRGVLEPCRHYMNTGARFARAALAARACSLCTQVCASLFCCRGPPASTLHAACRAYNFGICTHANAALAAWACSSCRGACALRQRISGLGGPLTRIRHEV